MDIRIALPGNPNSGKTTLLNALTGSNQFVGNWPGVTVEKKEGRLKNRDGVTITDLPGIYSLSPYTLEAVVARNYLIGERPDAILNIIDGTNLERNLYLTTQLVELGIPVVIAINMMDVVKKNGDKINTKELSRQLGCEIVEISALKGTGVQEAAEAAVRAAKDTKTIPQHTFSGPVEHAIAHIEEAVVHDLPEEQQRWYAIKIFERDDKVLEKLDIPESTLKHVEQDIKAAEEELDDDAESIITNERYVYIASVIKACFKKHSAGKLTTSDKIDKIVTNRILGLLIFAVIMFLVYLIAMKGPGAWATVASGDDVIEADSVGYAGMEAVPADAVKPGEYDIAVDSISSMFKIASCKLTVADGKMTAAIKIGSTSYEYLYAGTAEQAAKADASQYIAPAVLDSGCIFEFPVDALDSEIPCAALSRKKQLWYDRKLVFRADSLPEDALPEQKAVTAETLGLADGEYSVEVKLEGGSGKASVQSPAKLTVKGGQAAAEIVWSSNKYDYMRIGDEKYLPTDTAEFSVFEIPVASFDRKLRIAADTTAMSTPHEIGYTLYFDSASIK